DGFTDDDDWVYENSGAFRVVEGTFHNETKDGKIRISVDAKAQDGVRHSHYAEQYRPRQHRETAETQKNDTESQGKLAEKEKAS
ncbi:hypothetical protein PMAYCL1PPCAC_19734, partial [Pristionchus mayeri]